MHMGIVGQLGVDLVGHHHQVTLDDQVVLNPAYNRDRRPVVNVISLRGHVEF